jgi:hypothetical protein
MKSALAVWVPTTGQLISNFPNTPTSVTEKELDKIVDRLQLGCYVYEIVHVEIDTKNVIAKFSIIVDEVKIEVAMHTSRVTFVKK